MKSYEDITEDILSNTKDVYDTDIVIKEMHEHGIPFSKLRPLYKSVGVAKGYIIDPKLVRQKVIDTIDEFEIKCFNSRQEYEETVEKIIHTVNGSTKVMVERYLKEYCTEERIPIPKHLGLIRKNKTGGKVIKAVIDYSVKPKLTRRGLYDAILPAVKGPQNAYTGMTTYFTVMYAIKNKLSFEDAVDEINKLPSLHFADLEEEFYQKGNEPSAEP